MNSTSTEKGFLLVMDGNIDDRFRTSEVLRRLGYRVFSAESAAQAIEIMHATPPVGVLVDTGERGMTFLADARKEPSTAAVPVLVMAAASNAMLEGRVRRGLIAGILRKPLDAEQLFTAVEALLMKGARRTMRAAASVPARLVGRHSAAEGTATVLSEHGMFFRTLDGWPAAARLQVTLEIDGAPVSIPGEVAYACNLEEGPFREPGMGIKFLQATPEVRSAIAAFVREELGTVRSAA